MWGGGEVDETLPVWARLQFLAPGPSILALLPRGSLGGCLPLTPFAGMSCRAEQHIGRAGDPVGNEQQAS